MDSSIGDDSVRRRGHRHVLRAVGSNAAAKMVAVPLSAVLGIVVTRLLIDEYGEAAYAQYALIVGIASLLPFIDLGLGAAIMNAAAAAEDPRDDSGLHLTLVSSLRLLCISAAVVVGIAGLITILGAWPTLLGRAIDGEGAMTAGLCMAVIGLTLLVAVGQRLLAGLGKYVWVVVINAFQTPLVLLVLCVMILTGRGAGVYLALVAYSVTAALAGVSLWQADRLVRPTFVRAVRDVFRIRTVRGARVYDTAWPMLVVTVAAALALQTDRLVLSHVSTIEALAEYSLAWQIFNPAIAIVATATVALWPVFAKARAQGVASEVSPERMAMLFGGTAVLAVVVLGLASGLLADLASGGRIDLSLGLVLAFAALVVVQAVKFPLGTYLTDPAGLRFQALMISVMVPVKVALSLWLASWLGAVGPVIGSIIGICIFEAAANFWFIRRRRPSVDTPVSSTAGRV